MDKACRSKISWKEIFHVLTLVGISTEFSGEGKESKASISSCSLYAVQDTYYEHPTILRNSGRGSFVQRYSNRGMTSKDILV